MENINNIDNSNNNTQKTLKEEFNYFQAYPNTCTGCTVGLFDKNNFFEWKVSLVGPKDSSYAGGLFFLKVIFPQDYPNSLPQIIFLTPIYHINVYPLKGSTPKETLGHINEVLISYWKPYTAKSILTKLYSIFYEPIKDATFIKDRADEYNNNKNLFELKAKHFTGNYANIQSLIKNKKYDDKDWDFKMSNINRYYLQIKNYIPNPFAKKSNNNYINENSSEQITLNISINGEEAIPKTCLKNQMTKDVCKQFLEENGKGNFDKENVLFIFGLKRLNPENTIGQNGLKNNHSITVILDYKPKINISG